MKILLVSGHTSGYNRCAATAVNEGDLNIELVKLLKERLDRYADVSVYPYDRDMYLDNKNKNLRVDLTDYNYIFEVHFNASGTGHGTEVLLHANYTGGISVEQAVLRNIVALGFKDRGIKRRKDLLNMQTCLDIGVDYALLETCFFDKVADMNLYKARKVQVADAITKGIVDSFGLRLEPAIETPNADAVKLRQLSPKEFIELLAPIAQRCWDEYGLLPSVSIAQPCLETGYGKTELACGLGATAANIEKNGTAYGARNMCGLKRDASKGTWTSDVWDGSVYYKMTAEQSKDGVYHNIWAYFRSYETIEQSMLDRAQYLTRARNEKGELRFAGLVGETDYKKAVSIIKKGGYATSLTYDTKLINIIKAQNLTQYDPKDAMPYSVKVNIHDLNIRKGPGINYAKNKNPQHTNKGIFNIVDEAVGVVDAQGNTSKWGLLKSYAKDRNGWICLDFTTRVK